MGNDILFTAIDPRGLSVICTLACWYEHILGGHFEMNGLEDVVKEAIESPEFDFIYQDRDYPERNIYYKLDDSRTRYTKVVVEFLSEKGEVVTSHFTDSPKPGELMIWPRSQD